MIVEHLELVDFRNYPAAELHLSPGTTAVVGRNGQGKTNLVEALAYLATLDSFRGAPPEALVRAGADRAVVRAVVRHDDGRRLEIEADIHRQGRNRVLINRQRLARARDLLGVLRVTVFGPDDLVLVKGAPAARRRFLDDVLVALAVKHDQLRRDLERVLRQRNTLLKQAGGRLSEDVALTLEVWDARLASLGEALGEARAVLVERLQPLVNQTYGQLAGARATIGVEYRAPWRDGGLATALAQARTEDLRRGVSTVGPHLDELELSVNGYPARSHASQGEQRTLAFSLRLAAHHLVTERTGTTPVLVLDDVLSELDPCRAAALLQSLPLGQIVITAAGALPEAARADRVVRIEGGSVIE